MDTQTNQDVSRGQQDSNLTTATRPFEHPDVFHRRMITEHGIDSDHALLWHTKGMQFHLMFQLMKHVTLVDGISILDVGAGRMDLYAYLEDQVMVGRYCGVDYSKELLEYGHKMFPRTEMWVGDFLDYDYSDRELFDVVVACGVLPYMIMFGEHAEAVAFKLIKKTFDHAKKVCVFNVPSERLRKWSGDDPTSWYLTNPERLLRFCMWLTDRWVVEHNSTTGFMTVALYKEGHH